MFGWFKRNADKKLKESGQAVAAAREALQRERIAMEELMALTLKEKSGG